MRLENSGPSSRAGVETVSRDGSPGRAGARSRQVLSFLVVTAVVLGAGAVHRLYAQRDLSDVEVRTEKVAGRVHVLFGAGGNIAVSTGKDGVLMVDDQFAPLADKIKAAIRKLHPSPPAFVVNTHFHGDHTGGNPEFGADAVIVAHENVRRRVMTAQEFSRGTTEPLPEVGWPVVTYGDTVTLHVNGEAVKLIHFPTGHTDGDSIVHFTGSGVAHLGDHFFAGRFPFVDIEAGGDVQGLTRNVAAMLDLLPADTKLIPGHGPVSGMDDLRAYHDMLVKTTAVVREAIDAGKSLEEIQAAGLREEWDAWGRGFIDAGRWIGFVHASLTRD